MNALELFRAGHDTMEIARTLRTTEADAYDRLHHEREHERMVKEQDERRERRRRAAEVRRRERLAWIRAGAAMPKQSWKLTKDQRAVMLERFGDGEHENKLAAEFGVHPAYIRKAARRNGIDRPEKLVFAATKRNGISLPRVSILEAAE